MATTTEQYYCQRCHCMVSASLVKSISGNGVAVVFWQCPNAGGHRLDRLGKHLSHKWLAEAGIDINALPTVGETDPAVKTTCEYAGCANTATEGHHWAARGI